MRRSDGAYMTQGEMAETIHRLRLELDEKDDKIARLNRKIQTLETVVEQWSEKVTVSELDSYAEGLPV